MLRFIYIDAQGIYRITEDEPESPVVKFEYTGGDIVFEAIFALSLSGISTDGIELSKYI